MPTNPTKRTMDVHLARHYPPNTTKALVRSVSNGDAYCLIQGSASVVRVSLSAEMSVNAGDQVGLTRYQGEKYWTITSVYRRDPTAVVAGNSSGSNAIASPNTINAPQVGPPTPVLPYLYPNPAGTFEIDALSTMTVDRSGLVTGTTARSEIIPTALYDVLPSDSMLNIEYPPSDTQINLGPDLPVGHRLSIRVSDDGYVVSVHVTDITAQITSLGAFGGFLYLVGTGLQIDLLKVNSNLWVIAGGTGFWNDDGVSQTYSSVASLAQGGTGKGSIIAGSLLIGNTSGSYLSELRGTATGQVVMWNASGGTWAVVTPTAYAPTTAKYIVQQTDPDLTNAQAMGLLGTGLVKNATTTGIQSIAVAGTDYLAPGGVNAGTDLTAGVTPVARGGSGVGTLTGILLGNGTSAFSGISGTSGKFIRHNGTNWTADTIVAADIPNHSAALLTTGNLSLPSGSTITVGGNTGTPATGNVGLFTGGSSGGQVGITIENYVTPATNNATALDFILGSGYTPTARIVANLDNSGTAATSLRFHTYNSSLTEKARLTSDGKLGINHTSPLGALHSVGKDTSSSVNFSGIFGHNFSSGTPGDNTGTGIKLQAQTGTGGAADTDVVTIEATLPTAAHSSRTGLLTIKVADNAATRVGLSLSANGSDILFGIGSVGAVARPTYTAPTGTTSRGTFDQSTVTLAQLAQRVAAVILDLQANGIFK